VLALVPYCVKVFFIPGTVRRNAAEEEGRLMMWILRRGEKSSLQHFQKI